MTSKKAHKNHANPETECVKFPTEVLNEIRELKKQTGVSIIHFLTEAAQEKLNKEKKSKKNTSK